MCSATAMASDCCCVRLKSADYGHNARLTEDNILRQQVVMNAAAAAAARLVTDAGRYEHIAPVLRDIFDYLSVQQRIIFKIAVVAFNCICDISPV